MKITKTTFSFLTITQEPQKTKRCAMVLVAFPGYDWAKIALFRRNKSSTQIQDGILDTGNAFVINGLSLPSRYLMHEQNSNGHTHVFELEHFNGVNTDTVDIALCRK